MTDPFRDSETSAHARADELEKENEELAEQIAIEHDRLEDELSSPEVQRLEGEIDELEKQLERAKAAPELERGAERMAFWTAILAPLLFMLLIILIVFGVGKK